VRFARFHQRSDQLTGVVKMHVLINQPVDDQQPVLPATRKLSSNFSLKKKKDTINRPENTFARKSFKSGS
jgi:hypothetical protein